MSRMLLASRSLSARGIYCILEHYTLRPPSFFRNLRFNRVKFIVMRVDY